ncbi:MAG: hypothetical protein KFF49_03530, partial [Bacteroidales bacterium]|nr:hypothetical protein [Bacteroidales bacterium]
MKKRRDIETVEELFSDTFSKYSTDPGDAFRARLEKKLHYSEFMRFIPSKLNIWYVAAAVTIATVAIALVLSGRPETSSPRVTPGEQNISEQYDAVVIPQEDTVERRRAVSSVSSGSLKASEKVVTVDVSSVISGIANDSFQMAKKSGSEAAAEVTGSIAGAEPSLALKEVAPVQVPLSRFVSSHISGCEPLTVSFQNIS